MIDRELLELLCCPETHQTLRSAEQSLLEELNQKIAAGKLQSVSGRTVRDKLTEGLIREDGQILYPVWNSIPVMLVDEGIRLT
jgi:uncharacterized protein YbaR (Trm112 family)